MKKSSIRIKEPKKAKVRSLTIDPSFAEQALEVPTVTFSIPEVSKILKISKSFTYKLVERGELPSLTFSPKAKRVLKADLLHYIKTHRTYVNNLKLERDEKEGSQLYSKKY